jgi:hypothetical protein
MTFTLAGWMLYSMWAVLGLMGLSFLVDLFRMLKSGGFSQSLILGYLQDLLYYVFPLFLLSNMMSLDPTGWLLLVGYYIGAIGVVLRYLLKIKG